MHPVRFTLGILALVAAPLAANAAAITYDFTGAVISSSGSWSSSIQAGAGISGTLRFDLDNASPALSTGDIGTYPFQSTWTRAEESGSAFQLPASGSYVFSMTVTSGSTSIYSTGAPGTYSSKSSIQGNYSNSYIASETQMSDSAGLDSHSSTFTNYSPSPYSAYTSEGLPSLDSPGGDLEGSFTTEVNGVSGDVSFAIFTMNPAPVPLPGAAWLLISGLGGLGVLGRRKAAVACTRHR